MKKTTKKAAAPKKVAVVKKTAVPSKAAPVKKSTEVKKNVVPKKNAATKKAVAVKASPVHVQDKEKGLTAAEIDAYRGKLLAIRDRLRGNVSTMTDAALNKNRMEASGDLSTMPIHMADVGTDNFEQEQTLSFMQSESGLLDLVEDALERIRDGSYGICESCECRIPKIRLNFLPYASMCVKCAEIAQREDGL